MTYRGNGGSLADAPVRGRLRVFAAATACAGALALAACGGGSTVDSSEVTGTTATGTSETSSPTSASSTPVRTSPRPDGEREVIEPGATRASEAPDGRQPLSADDEKFLDALIADGIDVAGTEDQLIAAGRIHCTGQDSEVIDAVAGQLVAQERTDAREDDVTKSIAKAAETAYC